MGGNQFLVAAVVGVAAPGDTRAEVRAGDSWDNAIERQGRASLLLLLLLLLRQKDLSRKLLCPQMPSPPFLAWLLPLQLAQDQLEGGLCTRGAHILPKPFAISGWK